MGNLRKVCMALMMFVFVLLSPFLSVTAEAADDSKAFAFELSVDSKDTKEVETGDVITVVLRLKRTDKSEDYTMHAMQDEIRYDSQFFELVEGSAVLSDGIVSTDIAMVDQYREFYMNYLSMSGGDQWKADSMVGSFQLKVIGTSGVATISNQDYLVSVKDGSESYKCDARDVTIIISTECVVSFQTSGGSEIADVKAQFGEKLACPEDPVRDGYKFEGWYKDIHLTEEWDFEKDTVQGNMSLYAKWSEENVGGKTDNTTSEGVGSDNDDTSSIVDKDVLTGDVGVDAEWCLWIILLTIVLMSVIYWKNRKMK